MKQKKETGIFTSPFPYISLRTSHRASPPVTLSPCDLDLKESVHQMIHRQSNLEQ
jgi:hypothetical protein